MRLMKKIGCLFLALCLLAAALPLSAAADGPPIDFCTNKNDPGESVTDRVGYDPEQLNTPIGYVAVTVEDANAKIVKVEVDYPPEGGGQNGWVAVGTIADAENGVPSVPIYVTNAANGADFAFTLKIWGARDKEAQDPSKTVTVEAFNKSKLYLKIIPDSWGNAQDGWWYYSEFNWQPSVMYEDIRFVLAPDRADGFAGPITWLNPSDIEVESRKPEVVSIKKNEGNDYYTILYKSFQASDAADQTELVVKYHGQTYTLPVGLVMPEEDLFSGLEISKSTYLEHRVSSYTPGQYLYLLCDVPDAYIAADFNLSEDFYIDEGQNYLAELTAEEITAARSAGTLGKSVGLQVGTSSTWLDVRLVKQNEHTIQIGWDGVNNQPITAQRYAVQFKLKSDKAMGDLFLSISNLVTTRVDHATEQWEKTLNPGDPKANGRIHFMLLRHQHTEGCVDWKYASNTTQHWQVCAACGEKRANPEAHTPDASGKCTVCGYQAVTVSTIASNTIGTAGTGAGSVTVTGGTLDAQTDAVTIHAGGNSVQYDSAALRTIKSVAGTNNVTLVVEEAQPTASAQTQAIAAVAADLKEQMEESQWKMDHFEMPSGTLSLPNSFETSGKVVHLELTQDGTPIESFGGGKATVIVPYTVPADMKELVNRADNAQDKVTYAVYRVEDNGNLTEISCTVDTERNTVTWDTPSHSYYLITPKAEITSDTPRPVYTGGGDEEEEEQPARPFTDVANPKAWYYDAVYYSYDKGYFAGVSTTEFAPGATMNRAMFATVLYSMAGKPEVAATASFPDVAAGKWYTNGVLWGAAQGIISGYPDGTFGTTDPVTREQMAVLLWNYAGKPTATVDLSKFADADQISAYAKAAVNWAVSAGVLNGKDGGRLDPRASATRAEVAQIVRSYDTSGQ